MELIIGGAYQGKLEYACDFFHKRKEDFADGASCSFEEVSAYAGLNHLHEFIQRLMKSEKNPIEYMRTFMTNNPDMILICNELGCGLVPIDAFDRSYREMVGRILCEIAAKSNTVTRVYCGIGAQIK